MALIALMWAAIPPVPDNVRKVILNIRLSKLPFIVILNQWQTLYSGFRVTNFGRDLFKVIRL